jgi:hypothetical protein
MKPPLPRAAFGVAILTVVTGCGSALRFGSPPRTDRIDTLKPGISSELDIRRTLGEPRGYGVARLPSANGVPRKIWYYEFTEASGHPVNLKLLVVFLNDERYDGHLWLGGTAAPEQSN